MDEAAEPQFHAEVVALALDLESPRQQNEVPTPPPATRARRRPPFRRPEPRPRPREGEARRGRGRGRAARAEGRGPCREGRAPRPLRRRRLTEAWAGRAGGGGGGRALELGQHRRGRRRPQWRGARRLRPAPGPRQHHLSSPSMESQEPQNPSRNPTPHRSFLKRIGLVQQPRSFHLPATSSPLICALLLT